MVKSIKSFVVISSSFALILSLSSALWAQTTGKIVGVVTDEATGEPMYGVNILLTGTYLGASTDAEGNYFIINVPVGTYSLESSMIGYVREIRTEVLVGLDRISTVDFALRPTVIEGEEVTVVAEREIIHMDISNSQQVITSQQLEVSPAVRDLEGFLNKQPAFTSDDAMQIRGGSADQTGMMLDGMTIGSSRLGTPEISLPLSSIDQLSVFSGGFNAEYGNFRSGIISVTTKTGSPNRYSGQVTIQANLPQRKLFGPSIYDPYNYMLRPQCDPAVAFIGTDEAWKDDDYLRQQYARFAGWDASALAYNTGKAEELHVTPLDLYLWSAWVRMIELPVEELKAQGHTVPQNIIDAFEEHQHPLEGSASDWDVDMGIGGPIPVLNNILEDATFYLSYLSNEYYYALPMVRPSQKQQVVTLTLNSQITPSLKLKLTGYHKNIAGVLESMNAYSYPEEVFHRINNLSSASWRGIVHAPDYFSTADRATSMLGVSLNKVVSPRTFWNLKFNTVINQDDGGLPYEPRDPDLVWFGPIPVNEQPYGWSVGNQLIGNDEKGWYQYGEYEQPYAVTGYYSNLGHAWFDSTRTTDYRGSFDISSQLNIHNLVKAGADFTYTNLKHDMWSIRYGHPENVNYYKWERTPITAGAYIQDQLIFKGMIANIGLRADYYAPGGEWLGLPQYDYSVLGEGYDDIWEHWRELDEQDPDILQDIETHLALSPRLGIAFPVSERTKFYFNYGHFNSLTPLRNMYMVRYGKGSGGTKEVGNPNMAPPKTISYEAGVEYNLADQYLIRIAGYAKDVTGQHGAVRYYSQDGRVSLSSFDNNNYRDIHGVEFSVTKEFGEWLTGWVNYNYMITKSGYTGRRYNYEDVSKEAFFGLYKAQESRPLPQPRFSANVVLQSPDDWGPTVGGLNPLGGWQASLLPTWVAGSYYTWNPLGKLHFSDNLQWPARYYWDARFSKSISVAGVRLVAKVDVQNLFNNKINMMSGGNSFSGGTDRSNYLATLHLPMYKDSEFDDLRDKYSDKGWYIGGDDKVGDTRSDDKDYINDPDVTMFLFGQPRQIWFGLEFYF